LLLRHSCTYPKNVHGDTNVLTLTPPVGQAPKRTQRHPFIAS
jgi:hypothetical protein